MIFECNGQETNQDERIQRARIKCQNQIDVLQFMLDAISNCQNCNDVKSVIEGYIEGLNTFLKDTKK